MASGVYLEKEVVRTIQEQVFQYLTANELVTHVEQRVKEGWTVRWVEHNLSGQLPFRVAYGKKESNTPDSDFRNIGYSRGRLTPEDVREIRAKRGLGYTYKSLAIEYGVDQSTIGKVVLRKLWGDVD